MSNLDVLVVTALPEEFEAARQVASSENTKNPGVLFWEEMDRDTAEPYILGDYLAGGASMRIALARPDRMGGTPTAFLATSLVKTLSPKCLAMCGVCAGNPADTALGDIIIAEMTYQYDEGKRNSDSFEGDHRQTLLRNPAWLRILQDLAPDGLPSHGVASKRDSVFWVLEQLYAGRAPRKHPALKRYFQSESWKKCVQSLQTKGLIRLSNRGFAITDKGRKFVGKSLAEDFAPPKKLPFAIKVGPIASGNAVVKDGLTWDLLRRLGVRSVIGLEMEAATIGSRARMSSIDWVVVKGVMDHADPNKDDRYKQFAARASAEVLFRFLVSQYARIVPTDLNAADKAATSAAPANNPEWNPEKRNSMRSRAFVSMIEAMFDAHYFLPGGRTKIEFYQACYLIPDSVLARVQPNIAANTPLEEVAEYFTKNGLIEEALSHVVKKVRDDWDQVRPYAKLAIIRVSERNPDIGLGKLPALRSDELEIAAIKWFIADALFQDERDAWFARLAKRGLDLEKHNVNWVDFADNIEYYCTEFVALITNRIQIDIALIQISTSQSVFDLRDYIFRRASRSQSEVLRLINETCRSFTDRFAAFEFFYRPMRESVDPLVNDPLALAPSLKWQKTLEKYFKATPEAKAAPLAPP